MITDYKSETTFHINDFNELWVSEISQCFALASPKVRQRMKDEIESRVAQYDAGFIVDGYCDRSLAVDCHIEKRWGEHCLYVWLDSKGIPFYAGKSNGFKRPCEYKTNRTPQFKEKIADGGCHSVVVAKNIHSWDINYLERDLITYLSWEGYELVNIKDVPSKEKIELWKTLRKYTGVLSVKDKPQKGEDEIITMLRDWERCVAEIRPVIGVLDKIIGVPWMGKTAVLSEKETAYMEKG